MSDKHTILIIDDTPMIIATLSDLLRPFYNVKGAKDGEEGFLRAEKGDINLILLDISMPNISGLEVLKLLKRNETTKKIPVMIISSSRDDNDKINSLACGALEYFAKPFNAEKLLNSIEEHLA